MGKKDNLKKELQKFAKRISNEIDIEKIILFGSRATDDFGENSDVDLIIISDDFDGMNFFERVKKMYDFWEIELPVDFICYTKNEFNNLKKGVTLASIALKKGIEI